MRLHLLIQRHGLPVTRILWTTSPPSLYGHNAPSASSMVPAASSALTSSRAPNALYSNGGYTIAQLLEDVNEVIPIETEPTLFDSEGTGQWGLEDYVVEVGGSECLHFMEVEGLLRDGDEILIRALQISDLRARRLSGRHQISNDGKHLIDGVPFGKPFLKRPTTSRPAITIPPRKKRRTSVAAWDYGSRYQEEDTEWALNQPGLSQELSIFKADDRLGREDEHAEAYQDDYADYHEPEEDGDGTVIRHTVEEADDQASDSDSDMSNIDEEDLADELKGLEEDLDISTMPATETDGEQADSTGYPLRSRRTASRTVPRKSSLADPRTKKTPNFDETRRDSKVVTFKDQKPESSLLKHSTSPASKAKVSEKIVTDKANQERVATTKQKAVPDHKVDADATIQAHAIPPVPQTAALVPEQPIQSPVSLQKTPGIHSEPETPRSRESVGKAKPTSGDLAGPVSEASDRDSSASDSDSSDSDSSDSDSIDSSDASDSNDASDSSDEDSLSESEGSSSDSEDDSSSDSDASSSSESEDELSDSDIEEELQPKTNPPGAGSLRTKKSNQRSKLRRRLAKLKELGALPAQADFAALRGWEDMHGHSYYVPEVKLSARDQERVEFEAKRKKLLRDLESGGVDVTAVPQSDPQSTTRNAQAPVEEKVAEDDSKETGPEPSKRRTLDVASSRRLLFGSLGVRTPRTKEDEEATRKKLAGKTPNNIHLQKAVEQNPAEHSESDSDENWQDKLTILATECIYDDIELKPPPFPFEQRWDTEAGDLIRQRKGWGKKRKRRQQLQVYNGEEEDEYWNGDYEDYGYSVGDMQLEYDDTEQPNGHMEGVGKTAENEDPTDDLPALPSDTTSLRDLGDGDLNRRAIIAFKQLDLSKATNWQPTVSAFRVAEIHDVFEDQIFKIRLAKRDRRQTKNAEEDDEEDGEIQYSGFEMPGFDEEEDDGFRELSFADLIEPKLLRAADTAGLGDAEKPSISCAAKESSSRGPSPASNEAPATHDGSGEGRPSLQDTGNARADPDEGQLNPKAADAADADSSPIKSPQFVGFESPRVEVASAPEAGREDPASGFASDPAAGQDSEDGREARQPDAVLPEIKDPPSTLHSTLLPADPADDPFNLSDDDLQMISSPTSVVSFNHLIQQYFPKIKQEPPASSPLLKKEPGASQAKSPSQSSARSVVPNPFYEIDKAQEELQRRQDSRKGTRNRDLDLEGGDGAMDFLSLARSPSPRSRKSRSVESPLPSLISVVPGSDQVYLNDSGPKSPASQASLVDLTQSSPLQSPGGSDEDYARSQRLPRGSGWVQKDIPATRRQTRQSRGRRR